MSWLEKQLKNPSFAEVYRLVAKEEDATNRALEARMNWNEIRRQIEDRHRQKSCDGPSRVLVDWELCSLMFEEIYKERSLRRLQRDSQRKVFRICEETQRSAMPGWIDYNMVFERIKELVYIFK